MRIHYKRGKTLKSREERGKTERRAQVSILRGEKKSVLSTSVFPPACLAVIKSVER